MKHHPTHDTPSHPTAAGPDFDGPGFVGPGFDREPNRHCAVARRRITYTVLVET